jgi:hypothetical protein
MSVSFRLPLQDLRADERANDPNDLGRALSPFSLIRTVTVGSGVTPDLLTLPRSEKALAGFETWASLPPVGTFTPP